MRLRRRLAETLRRIAGRDPIIVVATGNGRLDVAAVIVGRSVEVVWRGDVGLALARHGYGYGDVDEYAFVQAGR